MIRDLRLTAMITLAMVAVVVAVDRYYDLKLRWDHPHHGCEECRKERKS